MVSSRVSSLPFLVNPIPTTAGKYLYLVPWRAKHEPSNGQRGHGLVARVDMNIFDAAGIDILDLPAQPRGQIPSIPDSDLRGFWGGFACESPSCLSALMYSRSWEIRSLCPLLQRHLLREGGSHEYFILE